MVHNQISGLIHKNIIMIHKDKKTSTNFIWIDLIHIHKDNETQSQTDLPNQQSQSHPDRPDPHPRQPIVGDQRPCGAGHRPHWVSSSFFFHLSRPWSIGWVALSFLVRSFASPSRYGNIRPNLHFLSDPGPIIVYACQALTDSLTESRKLNELTKICRLYRL